MENKILQHLKKAKNGHLLIKMPNGEEIEIGTKNLKPQADIEVHNLALIDLILLKGDIGFGEAYVKKFFTTSNIHDLLLFILSNQEEFEPLFHSNILYSAIFKIKNLFKKNSLKGSKKNIEFHYDMGNDFYSLWLDETMSYSSGIFYGDETLSESQKNKYQRILDQIDQENSRILEIGCGWGGFIEEASKKGHKVKGLTLSNEQKSYADQLIKDRNLDSYIALQDYRLEHEKFDNIVSIEMFEAVGKEYWDGYFAKVKECLKKDGKAVIQTIVIGDEFYKKYLKTSDYIREYIFPGGLLPSPQIFKDLVKKNGLCVADEFSFAESYSKTLVKWLDNFNSKKSEILKLGYDDQFIRKWRFYLAYCSAGFLSKRTNVIQYTLKHD